MESKMNEQIQELIVKSNGYWEHGDHNMPSTVCFQEEDLKQFTELLIRKCANVLDPNGEYTEKYKHSHTPGLDGLRQVLSQEQYFEMLASKKIKEHFGVEL
jgi:hypothetical protein